MYKQWVLTSGMLNALQDMAKILGTDVAKIDFAPFHRKQSFMRKTRSIWNKAYREPYSLQLGPGLEPSSFDAGPKAKLFGLDMIAAIQRQQSFPHQVRAGRCWDWYL